MCLSSVYENKCIIVLNGQQVLGIGAWPQKRRLHRCWLYVEEWCNASSRTYPTRGTHGQQSRCYRSVNYDSKKGIEYTSTQQYIYKTDKCVCVLHCNGNLTIQCANAVHKDTSINL